LLIASEPAVRFDSVSKRYRLREADTLKEFLPAVFRRELKDPFYALRDLSFTIDRGDTVGIIGSNGSGKSTILKIIAGVTRPSEGIVQIKGRVAPLIELGAGFHVDLTGRENINLNGCILGMSNRQIRDRINSIVEFAELRDFMDTPVKHYSSGMYLRLAFSVAVHCEPDLLLIDEALAVGDEAFRVKCLQRVRDMQASGVTIVLVSHSLDMVREFCSRAILMSSGRKVAEGPVEDVIAEYRDRPHGGLAGAVAAATS
jgi:ABC-type polysaccharide/polyol phosphate transport system ATPase subunit